MSASVAPRADVVSQALARDRLGVPAVVFFVMSAAAPLTVVAGLVTTGYAVTGVRGIPLAFLVIGAVLALFSVGYVAMARHVANAGAFYAYVTRGLGRPLGVAAAWVALLAYNALQCALYGAVGAAAEPVLSRWFGVGAPWWVVALVAWLLVAVLGVLRVDVNGTVLAVLLVAEIAVIVVFSAADLAHPAGGVVGVDTLDPANLAAPGVGAILALAMLGFVGFESAVVFSEESRDPRRTVPAATYVSVGLIAVLYAVASWAMTVAVGPDRVADAAREQGPELMFRLAADQLGPLAADLGHALFLTSLLAAMIAFHNTTARYFYALGREGVLPRSVGTAARRTGSPKVGSLLQSALGLTVIVTYAVSGLDPLVQLFFWGGTSGGLGVLLLTATTAVAIVVFFARGFDADPFEFAAARLRGRSQAARLLTPLIAAGLLWTVAALAIANLPTLLGVGPDDPLRWLVPGAYLFAAVAGVVWALVLRRARPHVYRRIGLGARATSVVPR